MDLSRSLADSTSEKIFGPTMGDVTLGFGRRLVDWRGSSCNIPIVFTETNREAIGRPPSRK